MEAANTMSIELVQQLADGVGGKIEAAGLLPDGSGFAVMSMPLPKDHWLTADQDGFNVPPMPFRMGAGDTLQATVSPEAREIYDLTRQEVAEKIREAGKYAVRCATMNGREMDFDPDALLQNLVVGMLGYWTEDGLSGDEWANPKTTGQSEDREGGLS